MPTNTASNNVLLTGASGFVGRHFQNIYGGSPLAAPGGRVDLRNADSVRAAVEQLRPASVLHLASQSSVASSFEQPADTYAINFLGTLNLLTALKSIRFQGVFVYVSSADVYGSVTAAELPIPENHSLHPRSPYAVSKAATESLCYQWSQTEQFRIVVVRPFNQIGPGHDRRFAIPNFAHQILDMKRGLKPAVLSTGDLDVTRDFTDVRDTVRALHLVMEHGRTGEAYNICSGKEQTLRSIVERLLDLTGVQAELFTDTSRVRPGEQRRVAGDSSKIEQHLGWIPIISIETTLRDIIIDAEEKLDG